MSAWLASVTAQNVPRILMAAGLLILAVVVLWMGLWYYRRRWIQTPEMSGFPWTLEALRGMRDRGDLTEAEFKALRATLLGQEQAATTRGRDPAHSGAPSEPGPEKPAVSSEKRPSRLSVTGPPEPGRQQGEEADASGETVWRFDLKKYPPG